MPTITSRSYAETHEATARELRRALTILRRALSTQGEYEWAGTITEAIESVATAAEGCERYARVKS